MRGYSYDRRDVTGRGLANAYAQTLGTIFSSGGEKPYEVEIVVAEVGDAAADDQIYRLTYDGSVADEHGFVVMGGSAEPIADRPRGALRARADLAEALALAVGAARRPDPAGGPEPRARPPAQLEVAVLDRARPRRKFRRLTGASCSSGCSAPTTRPATAAAGRRRRRRRSAPRRLDATAQTQRSPPQRLARRTVGMARRGPADLRDRERVRRHVHVQGPAPAVARTRSPATCSAGSSRGAARSNVFLRNGARLYLDVGSHPEYATPECDDVVELVTHDKAGERILEGLLVDAERRLHEEGIAGDVYLFKNNTDSAGNSYGCHENYLVGRPASSAGSPTC